MPYRLFIILYSSFFLFLVYLQLYYSRQIAAAIGSNLKQKASIYTYHRDAVSLNSELIELHLLAAFAVYL